MAMATATKTNGMVAGLQTTFPVAMLMSAFLAIAFYGVIELTILIFLTFKRWRGLYFWSLVISTWGIAINGVGYILKFFEVISANQIAATLIIVGWVSMVTGQSVVLYSRLHLVVYDPRKVRCVLVLIIANVFVCHVPVTVLVYGVNSTNPTRFVRPYEIYECVQLTIFALQEVFISALYIYYTTKILGPVYEVRGKNRKAVMQHLIYISAALIVLDLVLVCLQYAGQYEIQTSLKPAVYSIKLKLEFNILNQLLQVSQHASQNSKSYGTHHDNVEQFVHTATIEMPKNNEGINPTAKSFAYGDSISLVDMQGQGVMKTTEVIIEREEYPTRNSISERTDDQGALEAGKVSGRLSASSSQVQLAESGY